jgi:hypothetical protein
MKQGAGIATPEGDNSKAPPAEILTSSQKVALGEEVQKLLDREHRMLRFYGTVVLGLFTVLGIATYKDIRSQTTNIVKAEVEGLINRVDSETSVRRTLDRLVGRSVMTASMIVLRRPERVPVDKKVTLGNRRLDRELNLSFDDWTRLQKWVRDENLDQQDFSDTLVVLAAQDEERCRQDARDFLGEMLNPPTGSRYVWMRNRSAKRVAILENFLRPGLESPALEIATSEDSPREVRLAALDYLKEVQYKEGFDDLFPFAISAVDDEIALRALLTCAWLDPLSEKIEQEADKVIQGPPTSRKVEKAIKLATEIWYAPGSTSDKTPDTIKAKVEEERMALAKRLLSYAFGSQSRVVVLSDGVVAILVSSGGRSHEVFGAKRELFGQLDPYLELLRDAAAEHNIRRISLLAPWSASQRGLNALQLDLGEKAAITVLQSGEDGGSKAQVELSESTSAGRVLIARSRDSELRGDRTLTVLWTDRSGRELSGSLIKLSGSGFGFSLPKEFY